MTRRHFFAFSLFLLLFCITSVGWASSLRDVIRTLETPFQAGTAKEYRIFDYTADFFQESKIASLNRLQRANGTVEVAFNYRNQSNVPEVKFRWQYDQPTTQEIVSNGEKMWVYLPENNQVILSDVEMTNKARQNDPMTFLTGLGNLSRDFSIGWAMPNQDIDGNYVLELQPIRVSSLINKLLIVVDRYAVEEYQGRGKDQTSEEDDFFAPPAPPTMDGDFKAPPGFGEGFGAPLGFGIENGADGIWFPILSTTVYDPNGNSTIIEFSNIRVNTGISRMAFDFIMPAGVNVVRPTGAEMGF